MIVMRVCMNFYHFYLPIESTSIYLCMNIVNEWATRLLPSGPLGRGNHRALYFKQVAADKAEILAMILNGVGVDSGELVRAGNMFEQGRATAMALGMD